MNNTNWHTENRIISVLVDNESWILPYAGDLIDRINAGGDKAALYRSHKDLPEGFACFFLGCTQIVPEKSLQKHTYNLVIHESDLPKGRGFAPLTWQVLEGKNDITFCMIEAAKESDAGDIYLKKTVTFEGHELCDEIREIQGKTTIDMVLEFLGNESAPEPTPQEGKPTTYPRRRPEDSRLDISKTLEEQFPLLRVVDNERYPAFFEINGQKYKISISKADRNNS